MFEQSFEIKTCRNNSTLPSHRFGSDESKGLFSHIEDKDNPSILKEETSVKPLEMNCVHVENKRSEKKIGIFSFFRRNR